jgi:hypothetical protein
VGADNQAEKVIERIKQREQCIAEMVRILRDMRERTELALELPRHVRERILREIDTVVSEAETIWPGAWTP